MNEMMSPMSVMQPPKFHSDMDFLRQGNKQTFVFLLAIFDKTVINQPIRFLQIANLIDSFCNGLLGALPHGKALSSDTLNGPQNVHSAVVLTLHQK